MKEQLFREIYSKLTHSPASSEKLKAEYPSIAPATMEAIYRRKFQLETTRNMGAVMRYQTPEYILDECLRVGSVATVAEWFGLPVCALTRFILKNSLTSNNTGEKVSECLRNPSSSITMNDQLKTILIREIDPINDLSHPDWDAKRRSHGEEKEAELKAILEQFGVLHFSESDLRRFGYAKTPDFKLPLPVGLNNAPVCWVESKALFGDPWAHAEYSKSQYQPYINRYGPGAVVYWYGFVDELQGIDGLQILDGDTLVSSLNDLVHLK
jgi:hypothetical protein